MSDPAPIAERFTRRKRRFPRAPDRWGYVPATIVVRLLTGLLLLVTMSAIQTTAAASSPAGAEPVGTGAWFVGWVTVDDAQVPNVPPNVPPDALLGDLPGPVGAGLDWLQANQNPDGSWGSSFEFIVTGTVIETLSTLEMPTELDPGSAELIAGAIWLAGETASNHDFLARQIIALAGVPFFDSIAEDLADDLLALRNSEEFNPALPNWPEGGWGLSPGSETDCLTTALAMLALDGVGLGGGFVVNNRAIAVSETHVHEWTIATDATTVRLLISVVGATLRVRMTEGSPPGPGDPFFTLPPGNWLIVFPDALPFTPGQNFVSVENVGAVGSYSIEASYETPTFDTTTLAQPLAYLRESQNGDGGWGIQRGLATDLYITMHVLRALQEFEQYDFATELADGIVYVKGEQLVDGSFGIGGASVSYMTALGALNLVRSQTWPFDTETQDAITALLAMQDIDGSWDQAAYDTALAMLALWDHNQIPTANAGNDQMVADADGDCLQQVVLDGSASSDVDGAIVSYSWVENGVEIATGVSPMVTLTVGVHDIDLIVTDDDGKSAIDTVMIDIVGTGIPTDQCHCCQDTGDCLDIDAIACADLNGTPVPGACLLEACCMPDNSCVQLDATCCTLQGGTPVSGESCSEASQAACCLPTGECELLEPVCCVLAGGVPQDIGEECTVPEACCLPDGSCDQLDPLCCIDLGGTPQGPGSSCTTPEACCLPDDSCQTLDPLCCIEQGGTPQGLASTCTTPEACCLPDNSCQDLDPTCCLDQGGVSQGAGTGCMAPEACCLPDDTCQMLDPACCSATGGTPMAGESCTAPIACCIGDACLDLDPLCCVQQGGVVGSGPCTIPEACCLESGICQMLDPECCIIASGTPLSGETCVTPEACCLPDDTCVEIDPLCCTEMGGTPRGLGSICAAPEACCLPDDSCQMLAPTCCDALGGVSQGPGSLCSAVQACCLPNDTCQMLDALCCVDQGGASQGPGTLCTSLEACCLPDDTCQMLDPVCCTAAGGTPQAGQSCTAPIACCNGDVCQDLDPLCCIQQGGVVGSGPCTIPEACCPENGVCVMLDPQCCIIANGTLLAGQVCVTPEACCLPDGSCTEIDPQCCALQGGLALGSGSGCQGPEACCMPDDTCEMLEPACCIEAGGVPVAGETCTALAPCCLGDGTCQVIDPACCTANGGTFVVACLGTEACCLPDDTCVVADAGCCIEQAGTPQGNGSVCLGTVACCFGDGSCQDLDEVCCLDSGGTPLALGSFCEGDLDSNGIDDACEACPDTDQPQPENKLGLDCVFDSDCPNLSVCIKGQCYVPKGKYISFLPGNPGQLVALRVTMIANSNFPTLVGSFWWVTPATGNEPPKTFRLGCQKWYQDWAAAPVVIHVGDSAITSGAVYRVEAVHIDCDNTDPASYSTPLELPTTLLFGDCVGPFASVYSPPNGTVNLEDVFAAVQAFQGLPSAPNREWVDVDGDVPNAVINLGDAFAIVIAFQNGGLYPYAEPSSCP